MMAKMINFHSHRSIEIPEVEPRKKFESQDPTVVRLRLSAIERHTALTVDRTVPAAEHAEKTNRIY